MSKNRVLKNTAIGLREIGFDIPMKKYYGWDDNVHSGSKINHNDWSEYDECYSAPTIDEVVNWLLEKHNCYIIVYPCGIEFSTWYGDVRVKGERYPITHFGNKPTRSAAISKGINLAINYIKKNI